jgi:hypothetical protein
VLDDIVFDGKNLSNNLFLPRTGNRWMPDMQSDDDDDSEDSDDGDDIDVFSDDGHGDDGELSGISERGREIYKWKQEHFFSNVQLATKDVSEPHPDWAARLRNPAHVEKLMASFCASGSINTDIQGVVISTALFNAKKDAENAGKAFSISVQQILQHGPIQVFGGDHSREATTRLREKFKNGIVWKILPTQVYFAEASEETYRILRIIGNVDNKQAGLQLKQQFAEIVLQIRRHLHAVETNTPGRILQKKAINAMKEDYAFSLGLPLTSVGQIYLIARMPLVSWTPTELMLLGKCKPTEVKGRKKPKLFKVPTSAHPFTLLGNIPHAYVAKMLWKVVNGIYDVKALRAECHRVKATLRIQVEATGQLHATQTLEPDDSGRISWKSVAKKFPNIGCRSFIDRWLPVVTLLKQREPLPQAFNSDLEKLVAAANKETVSFVLC